MKKQASDNGHYVSIRQLIATVTTFVICTLPMFAAAPNVGTVSTIQSNHLPGWTLDGILGQPRFQQDYINHADSTTPGYVNIGIPSGTSPAEFSNATSWVADSDAEYRQESTAATLNDQCVISAPLGGCPNFGCKWAVQYKPVESANVRESIGCHNGSGFTDADTTGTEGTGFQFSTSRGDTNFQCVTCDSGGTPNIQDSGVARVVGNSYLLGADESVAGIVTFYINGAPVKTSTTHLRTATTAKTFQVRLKTLAATVKSFKWNAFILRQN